MNEVIVVSTARSDDKPQGRLASAFTKGWNNAAPKGAERGAKLHETALVVSEKVLTGVGYIAGGTTNIVRSAFSNKVAK